MSAKISILLPTRKRVKLLKRSVDSLADYASDKNNVEILIAYDKDDTDTKNFLKTDWAEVSVKAFEFERCGYLNIHKYYNALAEKAEGDWLFIWNDDAKMLTKNWDLKILEHSEWFGLLRVSTVNIPWDPLALFPVIPRSWVTLFGTLSPVTHLDWWIHYIAAPEGRMKNIGVSVYHDRPEVTGNNNDETFREKSYANAGRNPNSLEDYTHPQRQKELIEWRAKLVELCASGAA
jgi:hypothetical protein